MDNAFPALTAGAGLALAFSHAAIPTRRLPFVATARAQGRRLGAFIRTEA